MTHQPLANLPLGRAVVDRAGVRRADPEWLEKAWAAEESAVVQVCDGLVKVRGAALVLDEQVSAGPERRLFLGEHGGRVYFAAILEETDDDFASLRQVGPLLSDLEAGLVVHAVSLANWHATHTHCPRCGQPTEPEQGGHVRRCVDDGSEHYPRTDPAVIMAVVDEDDRILLGRQVTWNVGQFSTFAGFVEPGESLEAAVRREVFEEVGITLGEVTYLGSQPWPFPSSLMLGFRAEALTTEVTRHDGEIAEAHWFTREAFAEAVASGRIKIAPTISISRRLIEHWYGTPLT